LECHPEARSAARHFDIFISRGAVTPSNDANSKRRIESYIAVGEQEGAELLADGRGFKVPGHEKKFFTGAPLFDH
jgi:acyl-CoA reductase-like NAD-dependent aldehyde dehydrogenase